MEVRAASSQKEFRFHPSMIQTPLIDAQINKQPDLIHTTDPGNMWLHHVSQGIETIKGSASITAFDYDPQDPPLTDEEKMRLVRSADPVMNVALNGESGMGAVGVSGGMGTGLPSLLFAIFLSQQNIALLQKQLRYVVFKWSGHHIGDQSVLNLALCMQGIYDTHAQHVDERRAGSTYLFKWIKKEITRLNELVINECTPNIINNIEQHINYIKSVERPVGDAALGRPLNTKITGTMEYRTMNDILSEPILQI